MKHLICKIFGHKWQDSIVVGKGFYCKRCGLKYIDYLTHYNKGK